MKPYLYLLVNEKRRCRDGLSLLEKVRKQGMSFQLSANKICLSAADATSLHHCLQNYRQYYTTILN